MRYVLGILTAFVLAAGLVSALPAGATVTGTSNTTWAGSSAGDITVDGGYIYYRDLDATMQTMKWAAIYGNVSGKIVLRDASENEVYNWSISTIHDGHAIFTEASSPDWSTLTNTSGAVAGVDSAWSFGSAADNAANTFGTPESDTVNGITKNVPVVKTFNSAGSEYWETYLWDFGAVAAKTDFVFAGKVHPGQEAFDGSVVDFQVLVPVTTTDGETDTYNVYVELE